MQKRLLCYIAFFLISSVGFAQKEEFKSHCQALTALMQGKNPFHVQYSITVHGKTQADGKAEEGTMKMELYKSGTNQEIKMGDLQEVLHRDKLTCVVNHEQRSILLQRDTSYKGDNSILNDLDVFADSAVSIQKIKKDGQTIYMLEYGSRFMYRKATFSFSNASGTLKSIYAEFAPGYSDSYAWMRVDYQLWDKGWKPSADFPDMSKYLIVSAKKYKTQDSYKSYTLVQP